MQPKSFIKILTIIHGSLCIGLAVFGAFAFFQNGSFAVSTDTNDVFIYIVPIIAMAGYFGSKFVYQNLIRKLPKEELLLTKLQRYQLASIVKYALIEAPAFLALFAYYYSGNAMHLIIAICLIVYLFFQRPTLEKLKSELPLNLEEEKEFDTLKR
ncbi:hypothetical protein FEE95_13535 [Maribacter algarum]|uniref:Uncharacterized protein n=1 Tax=Maribacter algarum (ex Zhang et al. 2020) TaxID=2578118 RepID=A0A5S3PS90_9FLAO|nr:hypothetical protein [Maribacter algarum]TMM57499.1 hypothetical protein FEE95_13535 [Maribacter algarum]